MNPAIEALAIPPEEALAGLRVAKAVALADGELRDAERHMLRTAARALDVPVDVDAIDPASPEEAAAAIRDPRVRERVIQAAILLAMIDGEAHDAEVRAVERFAAALGVDEPRVANLRQLAAGHVRRMWLDLARRSFAVPVFEKALRERGLGGVVRIVAPMVGLGKDPDLARRYNDLGRLDEGTLGRAYWRFVVDNALGFPGEGVVAEEGVWHDVSHVLGGYGVDPDGEVEVVSFIAGYRREDPFFWLFTIALQFHLGIKVSPYSPPERGHFDPERVLRALARGAAMTQDISTGWDWWPAMARPLDDVRRELGVPPPLPQPRRSR